MGRTPPSAREALVAAVSLAPTGSERPRVATLRGAFVARSVAPTPLRAVKDVQRRNAAVGFERAMTVPGAVAGSAGVSRAGRSGLGVGARRPGLTCAWRRRMARTGAPPGFATSPRT